MPRILVTGATGFIGLRLVERLLDRGADVACLVRATSDVSQLERLGVERRLGSLADEASLAAALDGADAVYHLAGQITGARLEDFTRVNAEGVERLCRVAAAQATPPTVLLVSSLAATGPSLPGQPHNEATPPAPVSFYGRSKLAGEHAARRYADRLPLSILRPPVVFGPGDRNGLMLFKAVRRVPIHAVPQMKGLPLSLIYVDDLVDAMIAVVERGERVTPDADPNDPTGLYFAADPAESSYADMGRMAGTAMGQKVWVLRRRKYPFLPVAIAGDLIGKLRGKAPLFGMDKLREASASGWVCDPAKIKATLDWAPGKPLAERYAETYAWYREAGWF
ncbi:3 beta-hydroxysteroid dehydrogenase/Delta 5--_4-isomerase [Botrimarina colliarenosi]|uniref:3 beta-hydroxysteroid dehydrogenase/Delta 5-->4-isomerase n=1 Tax=Botrimarina colliarenosi TaxID=2528001 RepID=A0A5C6A942_9BACT|nr:NAD-dependent epimerase/dehydratase family protein [Botrimarina colliarenosi]TWT94853.1 3 beta-hydroxysteroid dehydrogenase/Delta 5-->4-isomerase [Botrimarina colliarenosi]